MAGQKVVLSGVNFTDTTLPVLRDDTILAAGSLLLFDPSHSLGGFSGVPSSGGAVPNIAWKEASAIVGSGDINSLAFGIYAAGLAPTIFAVERTSKGGVHGMISHTNQVSGNVNWSMQAPAAVRNYVLANLGHRFFFSIWSKVTRVPVATSAEQAPFFYAANTSNYLFHMQSGGGQSLPANNGLRITPVGTDSSLTAPVNRIANLATNGATGSGPTGEIQASLGTAGSWAGASINKAASRVIYRVYAEDMTVSGRTYADVDAIDYALWQAAFGVGGKFYGDTYSDPATIVP